MDFDHYDYCIHIIQKTYGWTDEIIEGLPFLRLFTCYQMCKYQDEISFNQERWNGAFITYTLNQMLGGKGDNFENWCNGLGMFSHKKKTNIKINKEEEIAKANDTFENLFLSDHWD